ncbi:MAG: hypothetical protein H0U74_10710 [Bradymonadaceae bacterium]|nr:hypothetical protein [Lujinxingiaceae bacterium]
MKIDIEQLRKVAELLLGHVEQCHGMEAIEFDEDCYWDIGAGRYEVTREPTLFTTRKLTNDVKELESFLDDSAAGTAGLQSAVSSAASILRRIGEVLPS